MPSILISLPEHKMLARRFKFLVAVAYTMGLSAAALPQAPKYSFGPKGCDFAVTFPTSPSIQTIFLPEKSSAVEEAELAGSFGVMRANCVSSANVPTGSGIALFTDRTSILQGLQNFATQNGLSNTTYTFKPADPIGTATMRGYKLLQNTWIIYEVMWIYSASSMMSLTAGHVAARYPSREISEFFSSARHAK